VVAHLQRSLLTSLVERGLAQNLDLQQAAARVSQARAALKGANAALLPSGQVSGQGGELYQSRQTPIGRLGSAFPSFERSTQTYELDLGQAGNSMSLAAAMPRDAARADWQASRAGAVAARLAVAAQIADTYVSIRMLRPGWTWPRRSLAQRRLADLVALQYRKGVAAELQWKQAEGRSDKCEASIPRCKTSSTWR
jgi:outer membrane protein TolC